MKRLIKTAEVYEKIKRLVRRYPKSFYLFVFGLVLLVEIWLIPLPDPLFPEDYSVVVLDNQGGIMRAFLNENEQWHFPPDENLPVAEKLEKAVLTYEDQYFYYHPGINPFSISRAFLQNLSNKKIISGASTITMQTARLMKAKDRTYPNKILEMLQAFKLELLYSKEKILHLYLAHAPYGGNIVGCRAASLRYFRKQPEQLSWAEAAVLAVLPNAPGLISPIGDSRALKQKRDLLLYKLYRKGFFDQETLQLALLEKVPDTSFPLSWAAPHLCQELKNNTINEYIIQTTIDRKNQLAAEKIVHRHVMDLRHLGIRNAATLIVHTQTGAVTAYVGSAEYFDPDHSGQVNGVKAPRSSGSILKPFLYALSMDQGIILPQTMISDIPTFYGTFSPSNSDQKCRGLVTARQALIQSLNIPAVRLLNTYRLHSFYGFLQQAGLQTLFRNADEYGLPIIIGGAETTLWDLAGLYRGLGRGGIFESIHVLKNQHPEKRSKRLVSPGSAFLTLEILNEVNRPGSEYYWQLYQDQKPLAWKTGTSYGQRDGWAIGVSPQWTIAVWVGNFNGEGNNNLSGASCAGPILFEIFSSLPNTGGDMWFKKPLEHLEMVSICSVTGYRAGPNCPDQQMVLAPVNQLPLPVCPWHKKIITDKDEKEQVCSLCWDADHKETIRLVYPPEIRQFLRLNGQPTDILPPHRKSCPGLAQGDPLKIIYPQKNATLWVPRDFGGVLQKVACRAAHQQKNQIVYWYLDTHFQGSSREKHVKGITLNKGWHDLEVVDESGNRDQIRFYADRKN
ncbi:MAG: penicillin-binding protein 1C [Calditrichaceae bacterium]|nr:penicillin-binding protein 1C [Calditrichaceae bacterium]RQV96257.1 MAG: penicillin-binding protein 1C [Calditrichota bacterium]